MNKIIFPGVAVVAIICGLFFSSCDGGGDDGAGTGTVALYITDAPMDLFSQVTATIDRVQLSHTGTATTCDVLNSPVTINIANLSDVMQLVNVTQCPAGPFNRIHIEFDKSVQLMSGPTGTVSLCSFGSFRDGDMGSQPNVLQCDPATNICTLDVNGAVNVLAQQNNKMGLDFRLKEFDVAGLGAPSCSVAMKVSPLSASDMNEHHNANREAITGIISQLSTTSQSFDLTRGNRTFSVLYSGITTTDQPGLDALLQRAQDDGLRTKVTTSNIDLANNFITAASIVVKVEGTVSNLVTGAAFSVNYGAGGTRNIGVDYSNADVEGTVTNGAWVDVKLYGSDGSNIFLAKKVAVESQGMMTED